MTKHGGVTSPGDHVKSACPAGVPFPVTDQTTKNRGHGSAEVTPLEGERRSWKQASHGLSLPWAQGLPQPPRCANPMAPLSPERWLH